MLPGLESTPCPLTLSSVLLSGWHGFGGPRHAYSPSPSIQVAFFIHLTNIYWKPVMFWALSRSCRNRNKNKTTPHFLHIYYKSVEKRDLHVNTFHAVWYTLSVKLALGSYRRGLLQLPQPPLLFRKNRHPHISVFLACNFFSKYKIMCLKYNFGYLGPEI